LSGDRQRPRELARERPRERPTMQDIAERVGVSKALVSLVFRNAPGPSAETRERVLAAADELGYRVNRAAALMTARRSHLIGVMANIRNSFHAEVVEHIVAAGDAAGYEIASCSEEAGVDTFMLQRRATFVFYQGHPEYDAGALFREYRRDVGRYLSGTMERYPEMPRGYFDDQSARAFSAFRDLAERERKRELLEAFPGRDAGAIPVRRLQARYRST